MSLNRSNPSNYRWRIGHFGVALATIGYVEAADEGTAMERAIGKFNISPRLAGKLVAEKIKSQAHRKP
jgi:hypothetical protein